MFIEYFIISVRFQYSVVLKARKTLYSWSPNLFILNLASRDLKEDFYFYLISNPYPHTDLKEILNILSCLPFLHPALISLAFCVLAVHFAKDGRFFILGIFM